MAKSLDDANSRGEDGDVDITALRERLDAAVGLCGQLERLGAAQVSRNERLAAAVRDAVALLTQAGDGWSNEWQRQRGDRMNDQSTAALLRAAIRGMTDPPWWSEQGLSIGAGERPRHLWVTATIAGKPTIEDYRNAAGIATLRNAAEPLAALLESGDDLANAVEDYREDMHADTWESIAHAMVVWYKAKAALTDVLPSETEGGGRCATNMTR